MTNLNAMQKFKRRPRRRRGLANYHASRLSWELAKRAAHQVVKYYVNTEKKFVDTNHVATISSTASIATLIGLSQGLTAITRIGDQVRFTSVQYRLLLSQHASAVETTVRLMVILDRQPNNAIATIANILESATVTGLREIGTGRRFHVLHDRLFAMSSAGTTRINDKWYRKINIKTEYNADNGTVADITTNNIFFFLLSDEGTNVPNADIRFRLRYIDN